MPLPPIIEPGTITPYLACSSVIACTHPAIRICARELIHDVDDEQERIDKLYTFVRDAVTHSGDAGRTELVWEPDEVISAGHALCFGKSHLLTALCRVVGIPAGLCYQRLRRSDGSYVLHALCAVWVEDGKKWQRLDARGNKPGINAFFSKTGEEHLAYPIFDDPGEWLDPHIYAEPWDTILHLLESSEDVASFIDASEQIQTPPRHPYRTDILTPVPVY
jgi:transglutaminase-like putative cysteine protease